MNVRMSSNRSLMSFRCSTQCLGIENAATECMRIAPSRGGVSAVIVGHTLISIRAAVRPAASSGPFRSMFTAGELSVARCGRCLKSPLAYLFDLFGGVQPDDGGVDERTIARQKVA